MGKTEKNVIFSFNQIDSKLYALNDLVESILDRYKKY